MVGLSPNHKPTQAFSIVALSYVSTGIRGNVSAVKWGMHPRKAIAQLQAITSRAPADLDTLTKASFLIQGLRSKNADVEEFERKNELVDSKLQSAENWFHILCGVGEDGDWPEQSLRDFIFAEISVVEDAIHADGMRFQAWPKEG